LINFIEPSPEVADVKSVGGERGHSTLQQISCQRYLAGKHENEKLIATTMVFFEHAEPCHCDEMVSYDVRLEAADLLVNRRLAVDLRRASSLAAEIKDFSFMAPALQNSYVTHKKMERHCKDTHLYFPDSLTVLIESLSLIFLRGICINNMETTTDYHRRTF
jgi:hypothetical protein